MTWRQQTQTCPNRPNRRENSYNKIRRLDAIKNQPKPEEKCRSENRWAKPIAISVEKASHLSMPHISVRKSKRGKGYRTQSIG
jgi:hypothetical protein